MTKDSTFSDEEWDYRANYPDPVRDGDDLRMNFSFGVIWSVLSSLTEFLAFKIGVYLAQWAYREFWWDFSPWLSISANLASYPFTQHHVGTSICFKESTLQNVGSPLCFSLGSWLLNPWLPWESRSLGFASLAPWLPCLQLSVEGSHWEDMTTSWPESWAQIKMGIHWRHHMGEDVVIQKNIIDIDKQKRSPVKKYFPWGCIFKNKYTYA